MDERRNPFNRMQARLRERPKTAFDVQLGRLIDHYRRQDDGQLSDLKLIEGRRLRAEGAERRFRVSQTRVQD